MAAFHVNSYIHKILSSTIPLVSLHSMLVHQVSIQNGHLHNASGSPLPDISFFCVELCVFLLPARSASPVDPIYKNALIIPTTGILSFYFALLSFFCLALPNMC